MAELLSAGVFIEEVASGQNIVQSVSTSNLGAIGFTPRGPTDSATLVTSYEQYSRIFGGDTKNSFLPKSVAAFYANGGRRAFIVRVMPTNSTRANCQVQSTTTNQTLTTIDAVITSPYTYTRTAAQSTIKDNEGSSTVVPGSVTMKWRGTGASLAAVPAMARDGVTKLIGDSVLTKFEGRIAPYPMLVVGTGISMMTYRAKTLGNQSLKVEHIVSGVPSTPRSITVATALGITTITVNLATDGAGLVQASETASSIATQAAPAVSFLTTPAANVLVDVTAGGAGPLAALASTALVGMPALDPNLDGVVSGNGNDIKIEWTASGAKELVFLGSDTNTVVTGTTAVGGVSTDASGTFDRRTGIFSLLTTLPPTSAPITVTGAVATNTYTATSITTIDTTGKMGILSVGLDGGGGVSQSSYVNVVDGSYSLKFLATTIPPVNAKILASYKINAWNVEPKSNGVWGEDLRIDIKGDPNYYSPTTQRYTKFTALVSLLNSTGSYEVQETFDELDFTDSTSATFFPDVINDLSDLITVTDPGGNEAPGELSGGFGGTQLETYSYAVGGGDETSGNRAFSFSVPTALTPMGKRSVVITYTSAVDGLVKTISDNGSGAFTGSIDGTGINTVVYSSGAVAFSTAEAVKAGTLVEIQFVPQAVVLQDRNYTEYFGATIPPNSTTAKTYTFTVGTTPYSFYTAGTDGSFTKTGLTPTFGRSVFSDSSLLSADYKGLYALSRIDEIMQVIIPDFAGEPVVTGDQLDYAATRASQPSGGDRFIILTTTQGCNPTEAVDWFRYTLGRTSKFAAVYWPWVKVSDPLSNNRSVPMPPLGHIAGIYARTDTNRNVGKSPGGTVDGALNYLTGLEYVSTQGERDYVYPNKINPLISSAQTGLAVWGVRTIAAESEWRYINARRLFMFVEKSVFNSTHWIVFENNGPALWAKIKVQVGGFLNNLFNDGYFAGTSASQAYFIICDESNNPQSSIDAGQVIIDIGIAPNKPAEFVRFRFTQKAL